MLPCPGGTSSEWCRTLSASLEMKIAALTQKDFLALDHSRRMNNKSERSAEDFCDRLHEVR